MWWYPADRVYVILGIMVSADVGSLPRSAQFLHPGNKSCHGKPLMPILMRCPIPESAIYIRTSAPHCERKSQKDFCLSWRNITFCRGKKKAPDRLQQHGVSRKNNRQIYRWIDYVFSFSVWTIFSQSSREQSIHSAETMLFFYSDRCWSPFKCSAALFVSGCHSLDILLQVFQGNYWAGP